MNMNILRYSLFGIAGDYDVDLTFGIFIIYALTMIAFNLETWICWHLSKPALFSFLLKGKKTLN